MTSKAWNIIKIVVGVVGVGATLAKGYIEDKEFDEKVAKAVSEELAKSK